jgi:hypothetical protein
MSKLNFTNTPLQKLLNKRNIFSRVDALEAKDEAPSLTAESLGEITPDAGDIYVTNITNIITNEVVGLPEAPIDGTIYGRKDAAWVAAGVAPHVITHLYGGTDDLIAISAVEPTAPAGGYLWVDIT